MKNAYNMLPEDFREKIMQLDSVKAAWVTTDRSRSVMKCSL